jgi:O-antigen/teichoic acid export membrane protein
MLWGFLNRVVALLLPFITRTIILYLLGANYLGIGTLFSSVLSFLSLTELGLSSAIVYTMYKPIANGEIDKINALLNYFRKLYRIIGIVMLLIGTIIIPVIPYLISGATPETVNVYILYYIYLINSVISYFFSGYRTSLLSAHQREDISTKRNTAVNVLVQFLQIVILISTKNFYLYAIVPIFGTILTNVLNAIITKKMYPDIQPVGSVNREIKIEIKKKLSGLIGTKLNSIVLHSSDTIIISAFLGLTLTAQYGNYYTIFNAVTGILSIIFSSMTASIGNKLITDSIDENYMLFRRLSFMNSWIVCWCCVCFVCLYEPFMTLWVGGNLRLGIVFACLMTAYFYIYQIQKTVLTFKDAAGIWYSDRARPYISMLINVVSNIILVQFIGIYGIVISTILAFIVSLPWANNILFKKLFKKDPKTNIISILKGMFTTTVLCGITYAVCSICCDGILGVFERLIICCILPNVLFFLLHRNTEECCYWKKIIFNIKRNFGRG